MSYCQKRIVHGWQPCDLKAAVYSWPCTRCLKHSSTQSKTRLEQTNLRQTWEQGISRVLSFWQFFCILVSLLTVVCTQIFWGKIHKEKVSGQWQFTVSSDTRIRWQQMKIAGGKWQTQSKWKPSPNLVETVCHNCKFGGKKQQIDNWKEEEKKKKKKDIVFPREIKHAFRRKEQLPWPKPTRGCRGSALSWAGTQNTHGWVKNQMLYLCCLERTWPVWWHWNVLFHAPCLWTKSRVMRREAHFFKEKEGVSLFLWS